jgi:hypothetical protein
MTTAQEELKIFQNILGQSPQGLNDPNLIGKFAKAKFQLNMMGSMSEMQAQQALSQPPQGTMSPPIGNNATSEPLGSVGAENQSMQPPMQNEGQGALNLPQ